MSVEVKVWGQYALFTRPDLKVERLTYPVITPSAARGVVESVLYKPEIKWFIESIKILKPIQYQMIERNEVKTKRKNHFFIESDRTQRRTVLLYDVAYLIQADFKLTEKGKMNEANTYQKYKEMFDRRLAQGKHFHSPYLGTKEFSCFLQEPDAQDKEQCLGINLDIGSMLYDFQYIDHQPVPVFFKAKIEQDYLILPHWRRDDVC